MRSWKFDLNLHVSETRDGLVLAFAYDSRLFDEDRIAQLAVACDRILHDLAMSPDQEPAGSDAPSGTDQQPAPARLPRVAAPAVRSSAEL